MLDRRGYAVVILVVSASLLALAGVVAAQSLADDAPRGNWDTTASTGEIILDGDSYYSVFQGERDIDAWRNIDGDDVTGEFLSRNGDDLDLERSVPRSQATGSYESGDGELTARVRTPRISRLDFYNGNGVRLSSPAAVRRSDKVLVRADWNFVEAEDLRIEVREPDGTRITREVLSTDATSAQEDILPSGFSAGNLDRQVQGVGTTSFSTAYWLLDPSDLRSGNHEIRVEGVEDLTFGAARETRTVSVGSTTRPALRFSETDVSRGERVRFDVTGAESGEYHAVSVRERDLRSGAVPRDVFRLVGETVERGATGGHAYGVVRVSSRGNAAGQIDTTDLSTGSVPVTVYRSSSSVDGAKDRMRQGNDIDSRNLEIRSAQLSLNLAGGTYTTGQRVDISGTASPGVRNVAMYVRDRDDWELVPLNGRDTTSVSGGVWRARGVVLSDEDYGGRTFRFPGSYSVAVVDAAELDSPPQRSISPSQFNRLTSSRSSVRTTSPTFVGNFGAFSGQVAHGDRIGFSGTSTGSNEIVVGFVGDRDVRAQVIRDTRGSFVNRQIDLDGMRRGDVTAFSISPGRDGVFGTGSATDADGRSVSVESPSEFRDFVRSFDGDGRTRAQRLARIRADSVNRAGSDDLIRTTEFRIADARTAIRDVVPGTQPQLAGIVPIEQGETAVVRGVTNRNHADTSLEVEVTDGPDAADFDSVEVEEWTNAGTWTAEFDTTDVSTGSYTVRVDDGRSTDTRTFSVVRERDEELDDLTRIRDQLEELRDELEAIGGSNDELRDRIAELEEERDRLQQELNETDDVEPADDEDDDTEEEGLPGFTVFAAVAALVTAALLARRRE